MLDYHRTRTSGWGPRTARKWFLMVYIEPSRVDGVFADIPSRGRAGGGP